MWYSLIESRRLFDVAGDNNRASSDSGTQRRAEQRDKSGGLNSRRIWRHGKPFPMELFIKNNRYLTGSAETAGTGR